MHNNYYFLRLLCRELQAVLTGGIITSLYSQHKDELMLIIVLSNETRYLRASLDPAFSILSFPSQAARAKRNSVDIFRQIHGLEIMDIVQTENDRSFSFLLSENFRLLFKMHGSRSNVILYKGDSAIDLFRNKLKKDLDIKPDSLKRQIDTGWENFCTLDGDYHKLIPTWGNAFDHYLDKESYSDQALERKYAIISGILDYLKNPSIYIHIEENLHPSLRLYNVCEEDILAKTPTEALNFLYQKYFAIYLPEKRRRQTCKELEYQIVKSEKYLAGLYQKREELTSIASYRHIGDLILANLPVIKPYGAHVELLDYLTNKQINIKLSPALSPQANAEKYYRKARNQALEIEQIDKVILTSEAQIEVLKNQLMSLEQAHVSSISGTVNTKTKKQPAMPYLLVTYMDYDILIGKGAQKNELLTFRVAKKEDLFLHARDTSGAHIIIRNKPTQNFPKPVIEKAASFAAFYSKSKGESLVRVLYTTKKYVRKPKNSPPGTVLVEKEKVILVAPEKP